MGIGTTAPDASAALDIVSSTKGALLPRVALTSAVPTPATGLLVFQTGATPGFYYNAGTPGAPNWQQIATAAGAAVTANNGLTKTGQNIQLGGTLVQATTIAQGGFAFNHLGGNVGVGTATPGAALDVQGDFRVSTTVNAAGQIAQLVNQSDTRVTSPGQSFTLPTAASITSVGFYPDYLNSGPAATLNIYQGSGTSGTLLVSQAVTMTTGAPYIATLTTPLALPAGQYTFVFAGADVQFNFALSDVYAGGNLFLGTTSYPNGTCASWSTTPRCRPARFPSLARRPATWALVPRPPARSWK